MKTHTHTHTPGPWRIDSKTRFGDYTIAAGESVRTCEFIAKTQSEANARLIAAAPELLDALKRLIGEHADLGEVDLTNADRAAIEQAREAISKAEGNA
jgi:hypothetical protein